MRALKFDLSEARHVDSNLHFPWWWFTHICCQRIQCVEKYDCARSSKTSSEHNCGNIHTFQAQNRPRCAPCAREASEKTKTCLRTSEATIAKIHTYIHYFGKRLLRSVIWFCMLSCFFSIWSSFSIIAANVPGVSSCSEFYHGFGLELTESYAKTEMASY